MHVYAFGSIVRGEVSTTSDIDLLTLVEGIDDRFDPDVFSIYSYARIRELWKQGNPFAWHLWLEAVLLYSDSRTDYLKDLGPPNPYETGKRDCEKFLALFHQAREAITGGTNSLTFNLSIVFLSIRNFATCFSLTFTERPSFSRRSALSLEGESIPVSNCTYKILERARVLSTRAIGSNITTKEANLAVSEFYLVESWMRQLLERW